MCHLIFHFHVPLMQKEISNKQWPHDGLWPIFVDQLGVKYKGKFFNTTNYYMALVNGSDSTGETIGQTADTLRDFAFGNSMRVWCIFQFIGYDCYIILIMMFELECAIPVTIIGQCILQYP